MALETSNLKPTAPNSSASAVTGATSPAPTFGYLTASSTVARYQHPHFRSLELLLPASLWSDSFLQARSTYTLTPSPAAAVPPMCRAEEPETTSVSRCIVGSQKIVPPVPTWSFMAITRNFKRARERRQREEEEAPRPPGQQQLGRCGLDTTCADDCKKSPFTLHGIVWDKETGDVLCRKREAQTASTGSDSDDGDRSPHKSGSEVNSESAYGLSASSCENSSDFFDCAVITTARSVSGTPPAPSSPSLLCVSTANACHSTDRSRTYSATCEEVLPVFPPQPICMLSPSLQASLRVFECVLLRVQTAHNLHCPLCSPARPPRWGRCAQPSLALSTTGPRVHNSSATGESETRARAAGAIHNHHEQQQRDLGARTSFACAAGEKGVHDTAAALAGRRAQLCEQAFALLRRHEERLRHLRDTKPIPFKETITSHPLAQACTQLGGLPLLRVLAATLRE